MTTFCLSLINSLIVSALEVKIASLAIVLYILWEMVYTILSRSILNCILLCSIAFFWYCNHSISFFSLLTNFNTRIISKKLTPLQKTLKLYILILDFVISWYLSQSTTCTRNLIAFDLVNLGSHILGDGIWEIH